MAEVSAGLKVGERVYYLLPRNLTNGRPRDLYLAVEIVNITAKRVICREANKPQRHLRVTVRACLTRIAPEGAWIK